MKYFLLALLRPHSALRHFHDLRSHGNHGYQGYIRIHRRARPRLKPCADTFDVLFAIAFSFKIAAVPFHMWALTHMRSSHVCDGFMSVGPKAAGFAVLGRSSWSPSGPLRWSGQLCCPYCDTHDGCRKYRCPFADEHQEDARILIDRSCRLYAPGLIAGTTDGMASVLNYMLIYGFMNIGAFAVVIMLRSEASRATRYPIMRVSRRPIRWLLP